MCLIYVFLASESIFHTMKEIHRAYRAVYSLTPLFLHINVLSLISMCVLLSTIQRQYVSVNQTLSMFLWCCGPTRAMASQYVRCLDRAQRHTTAGRDALDEWSARRRDHYLKTHDTDNRKTSMPTGGIRTRNPSKRSAADLCLRPRSHSLLIYVYEAFIRIRKIYLLTFRVGLYVFTGQVTITWLAAIIFVCYATVLLWHKKPNPCFEEVLQSVDRPGQGPRVPGAWGSHISRQSVNEGSKVVGRKHLLPLPS